MAIKRRRTAKPKLRCKQELSEDGKFLVYCGQKYRIIRKPADTPALELLTPAAIAVDFDLPISTVLGRIREGWPDGQSGTLRVEKDDETDSMGRVHRMVFLRRGDIAKSLAVNKGDTRTRFLYCGNYYVTTREASRKLGRASGAPFQKAIKDHNLSFEWIKPNCTVKPVLACLESELLRVKAELTQQVTGRKKQLSFQDGEKKLSTIFAREFAKRLLERRGEKTSKKSAGNLLRLINKWHRVGCPYLDGEELRGVRQTGGNGRLCVVLVDVERIEAAIAAELAGNDPTDRQTLMKSEAHRKLSIPYFDMEQAEAAGRLVPVFAVERSEGERGLTGKRRDWRYPIAQFESLAARIKADVERPVPPGWVLTTKLFDLCGVVLCKRTGMVLAQMIAEFEAAGEIPKRIRTRGYRFYIDPKAFMAAIRKRPLKNAKASCAGWLMESRRNLQMARWAAEILEREKRNDLTREEVESIIARAANKFPLCKAFGCDRNGRAEAKRGIRSGKAALVLESET